MNFLLNFGLLALPLVHARMLGIPTIPFKVSTHSSTFSFKDVRSIIVDKQYARAVDLDGETLIPPTLTEFAQTFGSDLKSSCGLEIPVQISSRATSKSIFLTVAEDKAPFFDAAGRFTSEGYALEVTSQGIHVIGASPLGVWWGTRTLLQQAVLGHSKIPLGSGTDSPGWRNRGIMLDVARKFYPKEFLIEMCSYLSFYKQNIFHLHLSDNLYNNVDIYTLERSKELYAGFRLNSDNPLLAGLSNRPNESYYRADFEEIQQKCAARGVTIIPEIESPGHAMVITQWKPEIALDSDFSYLNLSNPAALETVKDIWGVLLPWMHSKTVSIGADEYNKSLRVEYNNFVNSMSEFIMTNSSKGMRIWGTFPPMLNETSNINKNVSIQHWANFFDDGLRDYVENGIDVLNSQEYFYMVGKSPFEWYSSVMNVSAPFIGGPGGTPFAPYMFDHDNATNNPTRENPFLLGHVSPLWNDLGPNGTTVTEAYYSYRNALPGLADKQWGGDLLLDEYTEIFDILHAAVPGQNLDFAIPSHGDTILIYKFTGGNSNKVKDYSGNGYDGTLHNMGPIRDSAATFTGNSYITTPLDSKGRNYKLSFSVYPTSDIPGTLFAGSQSTLVAGNGTITSVTMISFGSPYSLNYTFPLNVWTDVSLFSNGTSTYLRTKTAGKKEAVMEFLTRLGSNGVKTYWREIAFEAPLRKIGEGFHGQMKDITLTGSV